ncbi:ABC transporter substrate-binding protein, partial [Candidatus Poribacteria bacterium]|nr:ABC transporter substrate-binding protein [Candidatus Poribacteria bacterium]
REVTLPSVPQRIVSIGPANTEILFAIGAGELVVGVDRFSDYPPEAKQLEQVGGLISPAFDKVVSLNPDLVIVGISIDRDSIDKLASLGLNVALIAPSNLNDIYKAIQLIGQMTNRQSQSEKVVADMQARVKAVRDVVAKISKEQRLRVFYELWPDPLRSAGPGSFIHDLIGLAGGINIASDAKTPWPLFSLETLVERAPQVIFTTRKESLGELKTGQRKAFSGLAAVRTGRVYLLDNDEISHPGPRVVRALEAIARALYPEQFKAEMEGRK